MNQIDRLGQKIERARRRAEEERLAAAGHQIPPEKFVRDDHLPDGTVKPSAPAVPIQQVAAFRYPAMSGLIVTNVYCNGSDYPMQVTVKPGEEMFIDISDGVPTLRVEPKAADAQPASADPPRGVVPRGIWLRQRAQALQAAFNRYQAAGLKPPPEWDAELQQLARAAIAGHADQDTAFMKWVQSARRQAVFGKAAHDAVEFGSGWVRMWIDESEGLQAERVPTEDVVMHVGRR